MYVCMYVRMYDFVQLYSCFLYMAILYSACAFVCLGACNTVCVCFLVKISLQDFSIHRIIGRGGFGEVYGCRKDDSGKMLVCIMSSVHVQYICLALLFVDDVVPFFATPSHQRLPTYTCGTCTCFEVRVILLCMYISTCIGYLLFPAMNVVWGIRSCFSSSPMLSTSQWSVYIIMHIHVHVHVHLCSCM